MACPILSVASKNRLVAGRLAVLINVQAAQRPASPSFRVCVCHVLQGLAGVGEWGTPAFPLMGLDSEKWTANGNMKKMCLPMPTCSI